MTFRVGQLHFLHLFIHRRIPVALDLQRLYRSPGALCRVQHEGVKGVDDHLYLVDQIPHLSRKGVMLRRVSPQAVGQSTF